MKTLLIICSLVMVFSVSLVQAQQYEVAPCGTKAFTTAADVTPGGIICLDIWLTSAGAPQNSGGVWIDFSGSISDIAYVSAGRCMLDGSEGCVGPWTNGAGANISQPAGVGTHMLVVSSIGVPPDGDGDLIVGTVTLQNTGPNDATVNFTTIPSVATWTPLDDAAIGHGQIVISEGLDSDEDTIPDSTDNCPTTPNPLQEDTYPPQGNNIGDACDCECDFLCNGTVDASDVDLFLVDFGRSTFNNPCTNAMPCNGDVDCNGSCDANDVNKFLADFGRSQFNNPCPACEVGDWCVYP